MESDNKTDEMSEDERNQHAKIAMGVDPDE
jgi:hypothetical protein